VKDIFQEKECRLIQAGTWNNERVASLSGEVVSDVPKTGKTDCYLRRASLTISSAKF
jgi:hypothetical protein